MTLNRAIFQSSSWYLAILVPFTIWAFWPGYIRSPLSVENPRIHLHGIPAFLWFLLVLVQAFLVKAGNRPLHRFVGKASYLLAPLVVISTIVLTHFSIRTRGIDDFHYYFSGLQILGFLNFAIFYALAIKNRRHPPIHARYMLSTFVPLLPPIFDRLLARYLQPVVELAPDLAGNLMASWITNPLILISLLILALSDWKSHKRVSGFPVVFLIFGMGQALLLMVYQSPIWRSFVDWYATLPFS